MTGQHGSAGCSFANAANNAAVNGCEAFADDARCAPGRRIYIHQGSFAHLAHQDLEVAQRIYRALAAVPAIKMVRHMVVQDGVALGQVSSDAAHNLEDAIVSRWGGAMTECLQEIVYRPADPKQRSDFKSVLGLKEAVVATCYDAQYYTFATSTPAAERMYSDVEKMSDLRRNLRLGVDCDKYADLTLIKGKSLAKFNHMVGVGDHVAYYYAPVIEGADRISDSQLFVEKKNIFQCFMSELAHLIDQVINIRCESQTRLRDALISATESITRRVVLGLP